MRKKLEEKYSYDDLLNKQQESLNSKIEEINLEHNNKMEDIAYCFGTTASTINSCEEDVLEVLYAKLINSKFGPTYLIYTKKENVYWANTYVKKILDNIKDKLIVGEFDDKTYYYNNNKHIMLLKKDWKDLF